jgi:adenylate cyclase
LVPFGGHLWEVDVFRGENRGLVVAEIELDDPRQEFEKPPWLGPEVTDDVRYYNTSLCRRPFLTW